MDIHDFIREKRIEKKLSQNEFYKNICARKTAATFENGTGTLKLNALLSVLDQLDCDFEELHSQTKDSFFTDYDHLKNEFLTIYAKLEPDQESNIRSFEKRLSEIYTITLIKKQDNLKYFNLYILMTISLKKIYSFSHSLSKTDLKEYSDIIKRKSTVSDIEYKIVTNLTIEFDLSILKVFIDRLLPIPSDYKPTNVDIIYNFLSNVTSSTLQTGKLKITPKYLKIWEQTLEKYPSYKYYLLFDHNQEIYRFLHGGSVNPKHYSNAFDTLDIIEKCEGPSSITAQREREADLEIIKGKQTEIVIGLIHETEKKYSFKQTNKDVID